MGNIIIEGFIEDYRCFDSTMIRIEFSDGRKFLTAAVNVLIEFNKEFNKEI